MILDRPDSITLAEGVLEVVAPLRNGGHWWDVEFESPDRLRTIIIKRLPTGIGTPPRIGRRPDEAHRLLDRAERAVRVGKLREHPPLEEFVAWAITQNCVIPECYTPLLESLPTPEAEPGTETAKQEDKTPTGPVNWKEIKMRFVDGATVSISVDGGKEELKTADGMGMTSKRGKKPTKQWELLKEFAEKRGRFLKTDMVRLGKPGAQWSRAGAVEMQVARLNRDLRAHFGAPKGDNPIIAASKNGQTVRRGVLTHEYQCLFRIVPEQ